MEQMVLQYEDSTINRSIHFVPVLGMKHITAERLSEPKLSDGHSTFHARREIDLAEKDGIQNDTFCVVPIAKWHLLLLSLVLSFDYH